MEMSRKLFAVICIGLGFNVSACVEGGGSSGPVVQPPPQQQAAPTNINYRGPVTTLQKPGIDPRVVDFARRGATLSDAAGNAGNVRIPQPQPMPQPLPINPILTGKTNIVPAGALRAQQTICVSKLNAPCAKP